MHLPQLMVHLATACLVAVALGCSPQQQAQLQQDLNNALSRVTVGNTEGQGVYLRRTPHDQDKLKAWPDGTVLVVVAQDVESEGQTWKHVRDPDGTVGYVPAEFTLFMGVDTAEAQRLAGQATAQAERAGWPEKIGGVVTELLRSLVGGGPSTRSGPVPTPGPTVAPTKPKLVPDGLIERTWLKLGGDTGELGAITTEERAADQSPFGTTGAMAGFAKGHIYWSKALGAHATIGSVDQAHAAQLGTRGWLGFPIDYDHASHGAHRTNFEGGYVITDTRGVQAQRYSQNTPLNVTGDTNVLEAELRNPQPGQNGVPTAELVLVNQVHPIWRVVRVVPSGPQFEALDLRRSVALPPCSTNLGLNLDCTKAEVSLGRVPLVPGNQVLLTANGDPIYSADKENIWMLQLLDGGEFFWRAVFGTPLPQDIGKIAVDGAVSAGDFASGEAFKLAVDANNLPTSTSEKLGAIRLAYDFYNMQKAIRDKDVSGFLGVVADMGSNEAIVKELESLGYAKGPIVEFMGKYNNAMRIEQLLELSEVTVIEKLMVNESGMVGSVTAAVAEGV